MSDKEFSYKYPAPLSFTMKRQMILLRMEQMSEQTVLQRRRQMTNRHMGRGSASLARKEMQIQVIRRCHFIPIGRSKSKT